MANPTNPTKPAIGDRVIVKPEVDANMEFAGVVFVVKAHGRVNIDIEATGPGAALLGRRSKLRLKPDMVTAAPDGYDKDTTATATLVPFQSSIPLGAVFTVPAGTLRGVDESTLLVVIGTNGVAYKAARLGGDNDRYYPKVARAAMKVVSLDEAAERIVSAAS